MGKNNVLSQTQMQAVVALTEMFKELWLLWKAKGHVDGAVAQKVSEFAQFFDKDGQTGEISVDASSGIFHGRFSMRDGKSSVGYHMSVGVPLTGPNQDAILVYFKHGSEEFFLQFSINLRLLKASRYTMPITPGM